MTMPLGDCRCFQLCVILHRLAKLDESNCLPHMQSQMTPPTIAIGDPFKIKQQMSVL